MTVFLWAAIGYVAGSFPSAWLVATATSRLLVLNDVKRNVGELDAHVLLKRGGGRGAALAAAMDVIKGLLPVVLAVRFSGPHEVAACAIGAVTGHCWPPILFRYAGRGLAAGAGTFLAFLPVEMVVAGIIRVIGSVVKAGGLLSTVGYVLIPIVAWLRGQPMVYVVAAIVINVLIFVRRLEGIEEDVAAGLRIGRAVWRRVVLDASAHSEQV